MAISITGTITMILKKENIEHSVISEKFNASRYALCALPFNPQPVTRTTRTTHPVTRNP